MSDPAAEVVAGCRAGDRNAQRQLYEQYHRKVFRVVVRMVGPDDAPDLLQEVFLRTFQAIGRFSGQSRFETWLYRLAVNECLQHLRRRGRSRVERLAQDVPAAASDPLEQIENKDLLEQALSRLEPDLRAVFLLREVEELSYREMAEVLEVPEGTVAWRLNRAREQLRRQLARLGWEC